MIFYPSEVVFLFIDVSCLVLSVEEEIWFGLLDS